MPEGIIINKRMDLTFAARKYEADKIALLGFFALGLLIAYLLTFSRYTRPLRAGRQVVTQIRDKGISSFLDNLGSRTFFLVKDARFGTIGFAMEIFTDAAAAQFDIQSEATFYLRVRYAHRRVSFFQSSNGFDVFSWRTEISGPKVNTGTEILLGEDGMLTVSDLSRRGKPQRYEARTTAIPDFLLNLVFAEMLDSPHKKIIVETINADGKMIEVAISRFDARDLTPAGKAEYAFSVDFEDDPLFAREFYLDGRGRILRIKRKNLYFERTTEENILTMFPELAAYILQMGKIPE